MKRVDTVRVKHWTLEEYERMVEVGAFPPDSRLELLGGEIVEKMTPQGPPHMTAIRLATRAMEYASPHGHDVRVQGPLALAPDSEPEPDVAVVVGSLRDYSDRHPTTAVIVIEVSDSTRAYDRRKGGAYARAGVPEYWIVDVARETLEVRTDPQKDPDDEFGFSYVKTRTLKRGESIAPLAAPEKSVAVDDLLP